ncbi:MAG: hypothetical protein ACE5HE_08415 [Phycisphaerae bacterium]
MANSESGVSAGWGGPRLQMWESRLSEANESPLKEMSRPRKSEYTPEFTTATARLVLSFGCTDSNRPRPCDLRCC